MKIKLSKIMAAVTALGVTFAGFTAFAAPVVYTTTEYVVNEDAGTDVKVISYVTGVATKGSDTQAEVTYYVSDGSADADIIYIDQKTAVDGAAMFEFATTEERLFKFDFTNMEQNVLANGKELSTAKFGSDSDLTGVTFTFHPGANYISQGEASVTTSGYFEIDDVNGDTTGTYPYDGFTTAGSSYEEGYAYVGKVSGNPSEYGIKITTSDGEKVIKLRALGCDGEGNFVVVAKTSDANLAEILAGGESGSHVTVEGYVVK